LYQKWTVPFRGGTATVWSDTSAGDLAVMAHLSLADPKFDAFYLAAGVVLKDTEGRQIFPTAQLLRESGPSHVPSDVDPVVPLLSEEGPLDLLDMFGLQEAPRAE